MFGFSIVQLLMDKGFGVLGALGGAGCFRFKGFRSGI